MIEVIEGLCLIVKYHRTDTSSCLTLKQCEEREGN